MSFSCPEFDAGDFIGLAKKYGFEGIEPRIDSGHRHGIEPGAPPSFLRSVREMSEENGIKICCIATSCMFSNPKTCGENIARAKQAIALASEVGAPAIRVFGGGIPENLEREKSFDFIVEALEKISDEADFGHVDVCLETHDDWCDPKWAAKIMRTVSRRHIAINWDIMHPALTSGYSMRDAFDEIKDWVRHVHVHDGMREEKGLKFMPIGEGEVDHAAALKLLRGFGYEGFVSGEWIAWEPCEIHLPREIAKLKSLTK